MIEWGLIHMLMHCATLELKYCIKATFAVFFFFFIHSCANDGISGHRRSGRIQGNRNQTPKKQGNTDSGAAQKPSRQNPSPSKRQRESGSMV